MIIYKITNKINGKIYIGKTTKTLAQRWRQHQKHVRAGSQVYLHRAVRKYGPDAFQLEIIHTVETEEELNTLETHYITQYQSHKPEIGYNGTFGGDGIGLLTEETRQKMRDAKTPEIRRRMSERLKGKKLPEDHCRAIGDSKRGAKNPWFGKKRPDVIAAMHQATDGKPLSIEHREKLSKAHQGKRLSEDHRRKLSDAHKGLEFSESHRANLSKALTGKNNAGYQTKWIRRGLETIRVPSYLLDSYIEQGWQPGRIL